MNLGLEFKEIYSDHTTDYRTVCRIYEEAIPAWERKSLERLGGMLGREDYRFVVGRDRGGEVIAFAVLFVGGGVRLLEYLAVEAGNRGRGVGGELFRHCAGLGEGPMLIEVEAEEGGGDRVIREKRVEFYRRLGCRCLEGLEYRLPLSREGAGMRIFVHGGGGRESYLVAEVRGFLETIYTRVYEESAEDERIGEMLEGMGGRVWLR